MNFVIGAAWGEGSGWSFEVKPLDDFLIDYTYYNLDFYAVGKRGSNWAGSRMIKSEQK